MERKAPAPPRIPAAAVAFVWTLLLLVLPANAAPPLEEVDYDVESGQRGYQLQEDHLEGDGIRFRLSPDGSLAQIGSLVTIGYCEGKPQKLCYSFTANGGTLYLQQGDDELATHSLPTDGLGGSYDLLLTQERIEVKDPATNETLVSAQVQDASGLAGLTVTGNAYNRKNPFQVKIELAETALQSAAPEASASSGSTPPDVSSTPPPVQPKTETDSPPAQQVMTPVEKPASGWNAPVITGMALLILLLLTNLLILLVLYGERSSAHKIHASLGEAIKDLSVIKKNQETFQTEVTRRLASLTDGMSFVKRSIEGHRERSLSPAEPSPRKESAETVKTPASASAAASLVQPENKAACPAASVSKSPVPGTGPKDSPSPDAAASEKTNFEEDKAKICKRNEEIKALRDLISACYGSDREKAIQQVQNKYGDRMSYLWIGNYDESTGKSLLKEDQEANPKFADFIVLTIELPDKNGAAEHSFIFPNWLNDSCNNSKGYICSDWSDKGVCTYFSFYHHKAKITQNDLSKYKIDKMKIVMAEVTKIQDGLYKAGPKGDIDLSKA